MRGLFKCTLLLGTALATFFASAAAHADTSQDSTAGTQVAANDVKSAAGASPENSGTIETVVVTAEKRGEISQDVPIALSVLSGEMLDSQGIEGFQDLEFRVPSLREGTGVTGGENVITLRGISNANVTSGGDSPIAYSVDGVPLGRSTSVDPEFFDISRIEVLRGPQGTLYGRNSIGGSINVITNQPTDDFDGEVDALVGDYDARIFRGWVNLPLLDDDGGGVEVLSRFVGVSAVHDGYQTNISTAPTASHNGDGEDYQMLRGEVLVVLSPDANILLTASENSEGDPVAYKYQWIETPARFIGQTWLSNPREVDVDFPSNYKQNGQFYSATLNWNLGWAALTSVSGYDTGYWYQTADGTSSALDIAHSNYWTMKQWQYSEEVRLAQSNPSAALQWVAGFFYYYEWLDQTFSYVDTGLNAPFGTGYDYLSGGTVVTKSWAPFGQIDFDLGKTSVGIPITLTAGARYSDDTKTVDGSYTYISPDYGISVMVPQLFTKGWTKMTGKVGLSYRPSNDWMLYASASTGYLSGGALLGNGAPYQPETVTSYEAGFKSELFEQRVQLNVSAFREQLNDMQVFVQDILGTRIDNAGAAHDDGLEAELIAMPVDGLRLNAEMSLQDGKFDKYMTVDGRYSFPAPGCNPVSGICNYAGHQLVQTPGYTVDLGAEYTFDTSIGQITPRVDVFLSGPLYFLPDNSLLDRQSAYTLTDLTLTWMAPNQRWTLSAFVRNLENANIISNDATNGTTIGLGTEDDGFTYLPPRTFGLRLGVNL